MTVPTIDDKIGIVRIKLCQPQRGVSAVMCGFFEANRVLARWVANEEGPSLCDFEIVFADGALLRGAYDLRRRRRGGPSLNGFVLRNLRRVQTRYPEALSDEYGNDVGTAFLQQYEILTAPG